MPKPPAWAAPVAPAELDAEVTIPGSKSLTARYLILAALADRSTHLHQALDSRDTRLMAAALRAFGVQVDLSDPTVWKVTPPKKLISSGNVDCGLAGTVMRFIPVIAALSEGDTVIDGDEAARIRPLGPVIKALRDLGVNTSELGRSGCLPLQVAGRGRIDGGTITVEAHQSSQFVSALLLAAPAFDTGINLISAGPVPSLPHIEMTLDTLRKQGLTVEEYETTSGNLAWKVFPGAPRGGDLVIEPDLSNAGPFLAAALVAGGTVRIPNWPQETTQAGNAWQGILSRMGATVTWELGTLTVQSSGTIHGIEADFSSVGELVPTVAALAALADSPSKITGVAHLRGHETDRLAALVQEINRLGGQATELSDGLAIEPVPLQGGLVHTYEDHRLATFGAILGLKIPGITIEDISVTTKTLPDFAKLWNQMLAPGVPA